MLFSLVHAESAWFITNLDADKLKKFFFGDLDNNTGITPLRLLICKYVGDPVQHQNPIVTSIYSGKVSPFDLLRRPCCSDRTISRTRRGDDKGRDYRSTHLHPDSYGIRLYEGYWNVTSHYSL